MKTFSPLLLLTLCAGPIAAQIPPAHPAEFEPVSLENFVVTASPFERAQDEIAQPSSVLAGQRLLLARQGTLGETLAGEPGISSTYFGPGASRPVIRGLGGDRIRVLTGGIGTLDASVISPDHAVSLDPLLVDRIEILRGPATLLYGGSAIGGVVNIIDARIPEQRPPAAVTGRFEARAGSVADERAGAAVLSGAAGPLAWRLDGFRRRTDDVKIPGYAETAALLAEHDDDEDGPPAHGRIPNTATSTRGAGSGFSFIGERGHVGVSFTGMNSLYGVPGHAHAHHDEDEDHDDEEHEDSHDVRIKLRQRRTDVHAELLEPMGWLRAVKLQFGHARYRHAELEGDDIGTQFRNRAYEGRAEFLHEPIGPFEGAIGVQIARSNFAAAGEEAFVPPSVTANRALFVYEEIPGEQATWQFGGRWERQKITPDSGHVVREHTIGGAALGLVWKFDEHHTLAFSATGSARAPNAQELYADGPHVGTGTYERGDDTLGAERSLGLDLSLRRRQGKLTGSVTVFVNEFHDYIFAEDTGLEDPEHELPIFHYVQRDARFIGAETELIVHLHESRGHQADLRFSADVVRGTNRTDGNPLPRLTPLRLTAGFDYRVHGWSLGVEVRHSARPTRLAPSETSTPSHTLVHASLSRRLKLGRVTADVFARATNLFDREARLHTSFLKDVAPLPGRDVTVGARFSF